MKPPPSKPSAQWQQSQQRRRTTGFIGVTLLPLLAWVLLFLLWKTFG